MCGAPVAGHPLVRHPAEQQYADRFRLIDRQLLQLVAPHIFMPVDVPALWTLEEAVECHHIPHDEFSHSQDTPPDSSLLEERRNRTGVEPVAPAARWTRRRGAPLHYGSFPSQLESVQAVRLTVSANCTLTAFRGFTNPRERVTPWLHPLAEGLPVVGWDLANRSVCEPEARDVALRRQPVCQMCNCGIRHEEWPPDFQEGGRFDDLHVPPKVAGAVPKIPVPAAAWPRFELHG